MKSNEELNKLSGFYPGECDYFTALSNSTGSFGWCSKYNTLCVHGNVFVLPNVINDECKGDNMEAIGVYDIFSNSIKSLEEKNKVKKKE